jgi:hypothetical protein
VDREKLLPSNTQVRSDFMQAACATLKKDYKAYSIKPEDYHDPSEYANMSVFIAATNIRLRN